MRKCVLGLVTLLMVTTGCSGYDALNSPGQVQSESPPPIEGEEGPSNFQIDKSYRTIRVRVWPIISPPSGDPYPSTTNRNEVTVRNEAGFEVRNLQTDIILGNANKIDFNFSTAKMSFDGAEQASTAVKLIAKNRTKPSTVEWKGQSVKQAYRGDFQIVLTRNNGSTTANQWGVVNHVSLEDYLAAVVPSEVPSSFATEAIKAQSVAARTYAVFHMGVAKRLGRNWDVDPTTAFQSYRGSSVEVSKVTQAVVATISQVLTDNGKVIEAFFSANSGGVTCLISECFGGTNRPYIIQKLDASEVIKKPGGTYTADVTPAKIDKQLRDMENAGRLNLKTLLPGYTGPQDIEQLQARDVGSSGRVWSLSVKLKNGKIGHLSRSQSLTMRRGVGITSALYSLPPRGSNASQAVVGHGFGHGVGMSQWGADVLARQNQNYDNILRFYYNNVQIETLQFN